MKSKQAGSSMKSKQAGSSTKSKPAGSCMKGSKSAAPKTKLPESKPSSSDFIKEFRDKKVSNTLTKQHEVRNQDPQKAPDSKVTHPFAKYNAAGLQCVLCSLPLPSGNAWAVHTQSRKHKENMEILREKATKSSKGSLKESSSGRGTSDAVTPPAKRLRSILKNPPSSLSPKGDESSKPELELKDETNSCPVPVGNSDTSPPPQSSLPSGFFDGTPSEPHPSSPQEPPSKEGAERVKGGESEKLPEGFFDDPKVDARKRGVKPQDLMEKEWESFQRVLETENEQSEQIVSHQDQEDQLERDFSETHQQSVCYSRAEELRVRQENLPVPPGGGRRQEDLPVPPGDGRGQGDRKEGGEVGTELSQNSDSEPDFNLDFDWRSQMNNF